MVTFTSSFEGRLYIRGQVSVSTADFVSSTPLRIHRTQAHTRTKFVWEIGEPGQGLAAQPSPGRGRSHRIAKPGQNIGSGGHPGSHNNCLGDRKPNVA